MNSDSEKSFAAALPLILQYEGGFTDNPLDHGGRTNKGIIQRVYDMYRAGKGLPIQSVEFIGDSEVSDIYYTMYWLAGSCDKISYPINIVHFDTCVNCGTHQAAHFLQRTVGAKDDGNVGPKTLQSVSDFLNARKDIVHTYLQQRSNFYYAIVDHDPSQRVFIKGWQNRIDKLNKYVDDHPSI